MKEGHEQSQCFKIQYQQGHYQDADINLEQLAQDGKSVDAVLLLGQIYLQEGCYSQALEVFRRAAKTVAFSELEHRKIDTASQQLLLPR